MKRPREIFSAMSRRILTAPPMRIDSVVGGLKETTAYEEIREIWKSGKEFGDLRTAAFVGAIEEIAAACAESGIFPSAVPVNYEL